MKRFVPFFIIGVVALLVGYLVGAVVEGNASRKELGRLVAVSWGDGKYGPAFYGAHVYLEPVTSGYSVRARVYVGRGNDYFHDCGELGRVQTDAEAVARWGTIEWREDGLHIGRGTNHYFLPKAKLESHR
jgi:hypothetical protein